MSLNRRFFLVSLGSTGVLVACAGGGTNPLPSGGGTPTPGPTGTATSTPAGTPTASPTPGSTPVPNTVAMTLANDNPSISSGSINVYVFGQDAGGNWQYLKPDWTLAPWAQTAPFPAIPFYAGGSGSGNVSQTIYLPKLVSARVYIAGAPLSFSGAGGPAPWTNDGSQSVSFDWIEYTWDSGGFHTNTTAVDQIGLALTADLAGAQNQTIGFKSGAITQMYNALQTLGAPWTTVLAQWPHRILNPSHVFYTGNAFSASANFLDTPIKTAWELYKAPAVLQMNAVNSQGYTTLYGQVDASDNFNFYSSASLGTLVCTIPSPFSAPASAGTPTFQVLACAGVFGSYAPPAPATPTPTQVLQGILGAMLAASLNRGVMDTTSGAAVAALNNCTSGQFYLGRPYENEFARQIHVVASNSTYSYGDRAYAFAYDDVCNLYSPSITDASPQTLSVTINPS